MKVRCLLSHAGALATFTLAAVLIMRPWLDPQLLPGADFPGFAAEVDWVRARLDRDGTLPAWTPERFGGSTRFMSNLKEVVAYPLAKRFGAVQGTKVMFLLMRIGAAFGMYLVGARCLGTPMAGLLAGYAYGFGAPANLQTTLGGHLDLAISSALFPAILLSATSVLRRRRGRDAVLLGALAAVEFSAHSYLQALIVPVIFLLLLVLRPWRREVGEEDVRADPALARRWLGLTAGALAVFLLLGASQAAWLAADLGNHTLHSPETVAQGLQTYVEHTPLLYLNRDDWLGGWLREHAPPGLELSPNPLFNQQRYLGLVPLVLCLGGWGLARSDFTLRRWFQAFLLLFTFQYWMSIGPQTLAWEMARSFHWPATVDGPLRGMLTAGALACVAWCLLLVRPRRRDPAAVPFARVELALGLALVQLVAAHSLFGFFWAAVPVLRGMRSPGHFFDLAPFAFYAMLAVAIAAGLGRVTARVRPALALAIAVALVVDFLPTLPAFRLHRDADALEAMRRAVLALPGEDGTLRIALFPAVAPPGASLVTAVAPAGSAWGWLYWQAGRYWLPYLSAATAWLSPDVRDPGASQLARRIGDALMRSGRLSYLLEEFGGVPRLHVESPWRSLGENAAFALWLGPPVLPMGTVFGSFALLVGGTEWDQGVSIADAFEHGVVTVTGGDRLADSSEDTIAAAGAVRAVGLALEDAESRELAARHAAAVLEPRDPTAVARWETFLAAAAARPPSAARYSRPAPDRMVLDVEGAAPGILFVSEAYHPWWRARVDGVPADVLRAQLAFMAVRLPAGAHRVDLELRPPAVVTAADRITQLSSMALAAAAAAALVLALRRRLVAHA
jgi:hypothetical protein